MHRFLLILYNQTVPQPESTIKSSPDTGEEVERAMKKLEKTHKVHRIYGVTINIINLRGGGEGGHSVLTYLTNIFNITLKAKKTPGSLQEAKMILFKKGDPIDIKNYRPISLLSHSHKIFTRLSQTRTETTG